MFVVFNWHMMRPEFCDGPPERILAWSTRAGAEAYRDHIPAGCNASDCFSPDAYTILEADTEEKRGYLMDRMSTQDEDGEPKASELWLDPPLEDNPWLRQPSRN